MEISEPAYADSVYWNGSISNDWFTDGNWVWDGHTPNAGDSARIDSSGVVIAGATGSVDTLFVGLSSAASLSISSGLNSTTTTIGYNTGPGATITLTAGNWTNSGTLTIGNAGTGTVDLQGGTVSAGTTYLGAVMAGGGGRMLLSGGASFTSTGMLFVGYGGNGGSPVAAGGSGRVTVTSGTMMTAGVTFGDGIGASGQSTLTGSTSHWINTGLMTLGSGGAGFMTVSAGASVSTTTSVIGGSASGVVNTLTVTGSGSSWTSTSDMFVGNFGQAKFTLSDAATATSGATVIARHSNSEAIVQDGGSKWTTGDLMIGGDASDPGGAQGTGKLTVSNGGEVDSGSGRLANTTGATGTAQITGGSSKWTVGSGRLGVGMAGQGELSVLAGGTVAASGGVIGWYAGSTGTATVDSAGSTWTNSGNLYVGNEGNGTLKIQSGGKVTSADGYVSTVNGSNSTVQVSGTNSLWDMTGVFIAGNEAGTTANVTLSGGGKLRAVQGTLGNLAGSTATMTVTGAGSTWSAFTDGAVAYSGYMNVGRYGSGTLTVADGGSVTGYRIYVGNEAASTGTASVSGTGSLIDMTSGIFIGSLGDGRLDLASGGMIRAANISIGYGSASNGTLNIGAASGAAAVAAGSVDAASISFGAGNGRIVLNHTATNFTLSSNISGAGRVIAENGVSRLTGTNTYSGGTTITGGTLIGTGSSFGTGLILNNGALVLDQSGSGTLANTISGSGSLEKTGNGTVTLTGANSYTGGTTITGGTLIGTTGSLTGNVVNNATLIISQSYDGTFAGNISGSGNLVKDGSGIVTLAGTLTYTGTTTVRAGQLIGNTTTIGGAVVTEGVLEFNQSTNGTYSSTISGTGSLLKSGSGTLTLTGTNTYSGGTTISGGTLVGFAGSFGSGTITNNSALISNQTGTGTLPNTITGTGSFTMVGTGRLTMTGTNSYTGDTNVQSGTLSVNGAIIGSVFVGNGGTLGGNGSVGNTMINSGGSLSPGNSIGTLTVNGSLTFKSGSFYRVEVDSTGRSDKTVVSGAVTIGSNVSLVVTPENGADSGATYAANTRYTIIDSAAGITGSFAGITENFAFLDAATSLSADGTDLYLTLMKNNVSFADLATTPNAKAAANAVAALGSGNAIYTSVLNLQNGATQSAFSQLSGEVHPTTAGALLERSRLSRDVITDRIRSAFDGVGSKPAPLTAYGEDSIGGVRADQRTFAVWSSGFGSWTDYGSDGNGGKLDANGGGFLVGADAMLGENWRLGGAAGYGSDGIRDVSVNSSASVDSYYAALYGGASYGPASLRFGAVHAFQHVDSKRAVSFAGFGDSLTGSYDAATTQVFAEGAWRFDHDLFHVEPYANVAYVHTRADGFTEKGGASALTSSAADYDQFYTTLGVRVERDIAIERTLGRVSAGLGWRHAFGDSASTTTLAFAGGSGFTVAGAAVTRDAALVDIGVSFDLSETANVSIRYNGAFGDSLSEQTVSARLGVRF